jgi:hypothetical protein
MTTDIPPACLALGRNRRPADRPYLSLKWLYRNNGQGTGRQLQKL